MAISKIVGRQQEPNTMDSPACESLFAPHMTDNWPTFPLGMANVIVIDMAHCDGDCRLPIADCRLAISIAFWRFALGCHPANWAAKLAINEPELPSHQWQQIVTGSACYPKRLQVLFCCLHLSLQLLVLLSCFCSLWWPAKAKRNLYCNQSSDN